MLASIAEVLVRTFKAKLVPRKTKEREKKKNEGDNIWKFWKLIKEAPSSLSLRASVFQHTSIQFLSSPLSHNYSLE